MISGISEQQSLYDVEIQIFPTSFGYVGELRAPLQPEPVSCQLGPLPPYLRHPAADPREYGNELYRWLFTQEIADTFQQAQALPEDFANGLASVGLRLRIFISELAQELYSLRWETLWQPGETRPLALRLAVSRYLRLRARREYPVMERPLRELMLVSNPEGLERLSLAEMDEEWIARTLQHSSNALGPSLQLDLMPDEATLYQIRERMAAAPHVFHLLAHVRPGSDGGRVLLADEEGTAREVTSEELIAAIAHGERPPRLVFLAAAVTEGVPHGGATLMALAPQLLVAGVEAVVVVQADMTAEQLARFTERFYDALIRTGYMDIAMMVARQTLYAEGSWVWSHPVLFSRSPDNRLFSPLPQAEAARLVNVAFQA